MTLRNAFSIACFATAAVVGCRSRPVTGTTQATREFLRAAARGDSNSLISLSAGSDAPSEALAVWRSDPALLRRAAKELEFISGAAAHDTAKYFYRIPSDTMSERVAVGLVLRQGRWLVYYLGFPDRQ